MKKEVYNNWLMRFKKDNKIFKILIAIIIVVAILFFL